MNHRLSASRLSGPALAFALGLAGFSFADEIKFDDIEYKDIPNGPKLTIVGLREGLLYFKIGLSEKSVSLEQIQGLKLTKYPELSEADAAMTANDMPKAEKALRALTAKATEDYVKMIAGAKLIYVLDWSNRFPDAVKAWVDLYKLNANEFVMSAAPRNYPKDDAGKQKALDAITAAAKTAGDQGLIDYLKEMTATIKDEAPPAAPDAPEKMPAPGAPGTPATPDAPAANPVPVASPALPQNIPGKAGSARDAIAEMLNARNYDQALAVIDAEIKKDGSLLSLLLYQKGLAELGKGQDMDAAISFMRSAIHFPRSDSALPSLVETAKIMAKQGRTKPARDLLNEARSRIGSGKTELAAEIDKLLQSLK